jgi:cyclomaltodextrin glucanotransferase
MDTVKHVNTSYWEEFERDFYGRFPDKMIVGEYFDGGPQHEMAGDLYRRCRMTLFDFEFRHALVDVFLNKHPLSRLTQVWEHDPKLVDATSLVTFAENHDLPRLRGLGVSYEAVRQVLAILMISRGVPCIYYGQEQDLYYPKDPGDPYCRQMMASFDESHELYGLVQKLARLRKENLALRHGETHVVLETPRLLAFERVHGRERVLLAVALEQGAELTLTGLTFPDGTYADTLSEMPHTVRGGTLSVTLPPHGILVLSAK